jgi:hypothetical protein
MSWLMTTDTGRFLAAAGEFLRADPARNSVMLTVTENLRVSGAAPAASAPLYGWWPPAGAPVAAAFMHTPGFPLMLSRVNGLEAARLAGELAGELAGTGRRVRGVNVGQEAADAFAAAWRDRTGDAIAVYTAGCACSGSASSCRQGPGPRGRPGSPPEPTVTCWPGGSARSPARSANRPGRISTRP